MALYPLAVKKLLPLNTKMDPRVDVRVVILHVAASEGSSLFNWFNGPSGGVESHFYIRYDGTVEQYRDTAYEADANMAANPFAISIETEGLANGTWTTRQLQAIKALLMWCHLTHGIPLVMCPKWDGSGIGYHVLFEDEWDGRHASCPGPNRIAQFTKTLVPWMRASGTTQEDDMPTPDDLIRADVVPSPDGSKDNPTWSLATYIPAIYRNARAAFQQASAARAIAEAQAAKGAALTADEIKAAAKAGAGEALADGLDAHITLTPKES